MKTNLLKNKYIWFIVYAFILITALTVGIFTYSRYKSDETTNGSVELEEFTAVARIYYTPSGETEPKEISLIDPDTNTQLDYIEMSPDEFKTLKMNIEYTGKAKTYCRFRIDCSWLKTTGGTELLIPHDYPTYTFPDYTKGEGNIYNNIDQDGWFYFTDILESTNGSKKIHNAITGVSIGEDFKDPMQEDDKSDKVRITVTIDCVQYNRVSALWKMTSLPWWTT